MAWKSRRIGLAGTILLPLLIASGCTGTDVITAGNGFVQFNITKTNSNNASRFETLAFTINQIALRPVDADANAAIGQNLGLLTTQLAINLTGDFGGSAPVPIPAGEYVLQRLDVVALRAVDNDGNGSDASCAEYIDNFPATSGFSYQAGSELDVVLGLGPNKTNVINLTIDMDAFIEQLAFAWRCIPMSSRCDEAWCLGSSFVSSRMRSNVDLYFSFD